MDVDERVRQAFAVGPPLNLGGADVPAALLMELLTGELPTRRAALRLHDARVTGRLVLSFAEVACPLLVQESEFVEAPDLYWARLAFTGFRNTRLPGPARGRGDRRRAPAAVREAAAPAWSTSGVPRSPVGCCWTGRTCCGPAAPPCSRSAWSSAATSSPSTGSAPRARCGCSRPPSPAASTSTAPPSSRRRPSPDAPPETFQHLGDGETAHPAPRRRAGRRPGQRHRPAAVCSPAAPRVDGEVSLRHSTIGGVATFTGATLRNPGAVALRLDRADVGGGVHLLGGCRVEGELRLVGTRVGRILRLTGAALANPGGHALRADNCTVEGPVDCRDGFTATGEVSLVEARVAGPVLFEGAHLDNPDGTSLRADGIVTGVAALHCCDGFTAPAGSPCAPAHGSAAAGLHDAHLQDLWCTGAEAAEPGPALRRAAGRSARPALHDGSRC